MADKTVAQEDPSGPLTGAELVRIVQTGNSCRTTLQEIADLAPASNTLTTKGDLLGFGTVLARLAVGTDGYTLTADSSKPLGLSWTAKFINPMTTAGDMIIGGASGVPIRLAAATNGYVLTLVSGSPAWAANSASTNPPPVNAQTGTAYTLVRADAPATSADQGIVSMNNASANAVTVPAHSSVAFPVGTIIQIIQKGAGQTTIVPDTGVTIRTPASLTARAQYSTLLLTQETQDIWFLSGDMT